jgi:lipopolysaccharide export system permease protein
MARPNVRILSRYLLRQHIAPLVFALAALTSFLLIQQIAKQLGNLVGKGLPVSVIVQVFALSIPFIVATTLPMAVLVAVLYAFTHLAADNEITAMKAGGVSVGRLLAPVLGGATFMAVLAFLWNDQVLPRSNHSLRVLLMDIQRKKPSFSLKEQIINEVVSGQFFLRAARIDPATDRLKDVTIYDLGDAERRRIISADSGHMAYTPGGKDLYLTLRDGDIRQVDRTDPTHFNRTFYRSNRIRVAGIGNTLERTERDTYRSDREMGVCEMRRAVRDADREAARAQREANTAVENDLRRMAGLAPLPTLPETPADTTPIGAYCRLLPRVTRWLAPASAGAQTPLSRAPPPHVSPPPPQAAPARPEIAHPWMVTPGVIAASGARVQVAADQRAMYEIEIHKKLSLAVACIVFALLGVPVAIHFPRGGIGLVIGLSLVVFTVYYIGLIGGEELGNRRVVSPLLAMWGANMLFGTLGLILLALTRRPASSIAGPNWADLKNALLRPAHWFRR